MIDKTPPDNHKRSNGCLMVFGVLVIVIAGFYGAMKYAQRPNYKPTFYAVVTIDAKVNGYPVHIERTINCQYFPIGNPDNLQITLTRPWESLFEPRSTQIFAIPAAFGHILPDGSAFMVQTPYRCGRETYIDGNGEEQVKVQEWNNPRIPFMGWSPDGEEVKTLEVYISNRALNGPEARIQDLKVDVQLADNPASAIVDSFAWFSGLYHSQLWANDGPAKPYGFDRRELNRDKFNTTYKQSKRYKKYSFTTYGGWVLEASDWRGVDGELDAYLDGITETAYIPRKYKDNIEEVVARSLDPSELPLGSGLPFSDSWGGLGYGSTKWPPGNIQRFSSRLRHHSIVDFDQLDGRIVLQPNLKTGVLTLTESEALFRDIRVASKESQKPYSAFEIDADVVEKPNNFFDSFYDPESQKLYLVRRFRLGTDLPSGHPILTNQ